jgi:hypothetical protein
VSGYLDEPAEDRTTDEFWQQQWNLEGDGLYTLLSLSREFRTELEIPYVGGSPGYTFHLSGSVSCKSGGGAFLRAIGREIERLRIKPAEGQTNES